VRDPLFATLRAGSRPNPYFRLKKMFKRKNSGQSLNQVSGFEVNEMSQEKDILRQKFSSDPNKYYRVALFAELGYERRQCPSCRRYFGHLILHERIAPSSLAKNTGSLEVHQPGRNLSMWRHGRQSQTSLQETDTRKYRGIL